MKARVDMNAWFQRTIRRLVREAAENRLSDFGGIPVFGAPIVGVADGDGEVFRSFRNAVSDRHILPGEILNRDASDGAGQGPVRVVSWALPYSPEIRRSNRTQEWPSHIYSVARNNAGALLHELGRRVVELVGDEGFEAVAPALADEYDAFRNPEHTFTSTWSERHVAFAAGLGSFGLNGSLITPKGAMVRLGSLITNMPLRVAGREEKDHRAPCLRDGGKNCGHCLARCPVQAISADGLDKSRCYDRRRVIREKFLESYASKFRMLSAPIVKSGRREAGYSLGCGLCYSGVPCEASDSISRRRE